MKSISFFICAVLSLLLCACANNLEEIVSPEERNPFSIQVEATLESFEETETKATISSTISPKWVATDEITVVNLSTSTVLGDIHTTGTGVKATFQGQLNGSAASGNTLLFVYPSLGLSAGDAFESTYTDYSSVQNGSTAPFAAFSTYKLTDADVSNDNFGPINATFTFLMAYFKLNLSSLPAETLVNRIEIDDASSIITCTRNSAGTNLSPSTTGIKTLVIAPQKSTNVQGTVSMVFSCAALETGVKNVRVYTDSEVYHSFLNVTSKRNPNTYTNVNVSDFKLVGGIYNGQEYVDLGLPSGTMWAKYDVGSSSDANGTGFMWGMTETKRIANWTYYLCGSAQCGTDADPLLKYYTHQYDFSGTQYDAATANLGGAWRTPTLEDYQELGSMYSGGGKYTGNGNEILFNTSNTDYYWTSTPSEREMTAVSVLHSTSVSYPDFRVRATQFPVRPVFDVFSLSETVLEFPVNPDLSDPSTYPALSISCIDNNVNWRLVDYEKYKMGEKLIYLGDLEGSGNQTVKLNLMPNDEGCERIIELVFEAWYEGDNALFKNADGTPKVYTKKLHIYQAASEEESVLLPGEVNN